MEIDFSKLLPHQEPFVLPSGLVEFESLKSIHTYRDIVKEDYFLNGHFPGEPIFPGVMILEFMAQTAGSLLLLSELSGQKMYLVKVDKARFSSLVCPPVRLHSKVDLVRRRGIIFEFNAEAFVDDKLVAKAVITLAIKE